MKQYVFTILWCFLFKRSGDADMEVALKMVEYLGSEMDYVPWQAARRELSYVEKMLTRSNLYGKFKVLSWQTDFSYRKLKLNKLYFKTWNKSVWWFLNDCTWLIAVASTEHDIAFASTEHCLLFYWVTLIKLFWLMQLQIKKAWSSALFNTFNG